MPQGRFPPPSDAAIARNNERAMKQKYQVYIITRTGAVRLRGTNRAPPDGVLCKWASNLNGAFVVRFYPRFKCWIITDVRKAIYVQVGDSYGKWLGYIRGLNQYPSADAAVMVAVHMLARQGSTG